MVEFDASILEGTTEEREDIAVIGMAGRFPMADNLDEFWENLKSGKECVSFFSDEELAEAGIEQAVASSPNFVGARAILADPADFDAGFFGMSPKEAELTDPQHRVFLECAWQALENAGYDSMRYDGLIGVYAGSDINSYALTRNLLLGAEWLPALFGNDKDYLATRVAFKMNLKGPALSIQTACSTSLSAVQLACQGLLDYQSDIALAGGVGIAFPQKAGYWYQEGGMLSPDGHCRSFDENSKGTVGGDGAGVVVLKRHSEAIADGDTILAVIRGAALNNDGAEKVGFTAPGIEGQSQVIAMAQAAAEVDPETITYIEAHGTGTELGDPVEIAALTDAFAAQTDKRGFCAIGSLKSNVGHMNSAAGVGALIKTILSLRHRMIPPSLHFNSPNPKIDFESSPFYVNAALTPWEGCGTPLRAGVSSFGVGGTNAHVILEEAGEPSSGSPSRMRQLLILSAASDSALRSACSNLADLFTRHPDTSLADAAFTLQTGRRLLKHRRQIVCDSLTSAVAALTDPSRLQVRTVVRAPAHRPVAFMFPGQGAQYVNMARDLYDREPLFREEVDWCAELLTKHTGEDLRRILFPAEEEREAAAARLLSTEITQPALFVVEYALARLWIAWGVEPTAMIGHSIGEYVAACLSGVLTLPDAIRLVAARGRLIGKAKPGAMLAADLCQSEARNLSGVCIAAVNAPSFVVLSGERETIERTRNQLTADGRACRLLHTSHAFHSEMMDPVLDAFREIVGGVSLSAPTIPFLSNVTGTWITDAEATDPEYWVRHIRTTVLFEAGMTELLSDPDRILLEVGPGRTLTGLVQKRFGQTEDRVAVASLPHPKESRDDLEVLLDSLGQLYCADVPVDWSGFYTPETRKRIPLPAYPFQRQTYLHEAVPLAGGAVPALSGKDPDAGNWLYLPSWKRAAAALRPAASESMHENWLLLVHQGSPYARIAQRLSGICRSVTIVYPADHFKSLEGGHYQLDPASGKDYETLITELYGQDRFPHHVAHLWNLEEESLRSQSTQKEQSSPPEQVKTHSRTEGMEGQPPAQAMGDHSPAKGMNTDPGKGPHARASEIDPADRFNALLFLAQALAHRTDDREVKIHIAASGIWEVTGGEGIRPENAPLQGLARVIPQECRQIGCRIIDFKPAAQAHGSFDSVAAQLFSELTSGHFETSVACRGKFRWVEAFESVPAPPQPAEASPLRKGGVYLITGGLGRIGLVLAKAIAKTVPARIVLLSRSGLPPREEWDTWLASHDNRDKIAGRIRKVLEIEAEGSEVLPLSADVTDASAMGEAITLIGKLYGAIDGVIHGAGLMGRELFRATKDLQPEQVERHFRPKIEGLSTLAAALPSSVDFCMLLSSVSTALGGVGLSAYAAANHYMDAFALRENRRGKTRWTSVCWDAWTPEEGAGGQAPQAAAMGQFAITPAEGAEIFSRILALDPGDRVVVSTMDLATRIRHWVKNQPESPHQGGRKTSREEGSGGHARPELDTEYVAPANETETLLAEMFQELLDIDKIGVRDNFFQLGGDSLAAIQLATRLRDELRIEIDVNSLFDEPTIAALAEKVKGLIAAEESREDEISLKLDMIETLSDEEVQRMLAELGE